MRSAYQQQRQQPLLRQGWQGHQGHQNRKTVTFANGGGGYYNYGVGSAMDAFHLYDFVATRLVVRDFRPHVTSAITRLHSALKVHGAELEHHCAPYVDLYQKVFKDACGDGNLDLVARLQLLEIGEMRSALNQHQRVSGGHNFHATFQPSERYRIEEQAQEEDMSEYLDMATASLASLIMGGCSGGSRLDQQAALRPRQCRHQGQFVELVEQKASSGPVIRYDRKTLLMIGQSMAGVDPGWLARWEEFKRTPDLPKDLFPGVSLGPLSSRLPKPDDPLPDVSGYVVQRAWRLPFHSNNNVGQVAAVGDAGVGGGFSSFRPNANIPMRVWDEVAEKWVENF